MDRVLSFVVFPRLTATYDKDILVDKIYQARHHLWSQGLCPLADIHKFIIPRHHELLQARRFTFLTEGKNTVIDLHGVAVLEIEPLVFDSDQLVYLFLVHKEGRLEFVASVPGEVRG